MTDQQNWTIDRFIPSDDVPENVENRDMGRVLPNGARSWIFHVGFAGSRSLFGLRFSKDDTVKLQCFVPVTRNTLDEMITTAAAETLDAGIITVGDIFSNVSMKEAIFGSNNADVPNSDLDLVNVSFDSEDHFAAPIFKISVSGQESERRVSTIFRFIKIANDQITAAELAWGPEADPEKIIIMDVVHHRQRIRPIPRTIPPSERRPQQQLLRDTRNVYNSRRIDQRDAALEQRNERVQASMFIGYRGTTGRNNRREHDAAQPSDLSARIDRLICKR